MNATSLTKVQLKNVVDRINGVFGKKYPGQRYYVPSFLEDFREVGGAALSIFCSSGFIVHAISINKKLQVHFHNHKTSDLQTLINIAILQKTNKEDKLDLCGCAQVYFLILSKFWKNHNYISGIGYNYFKNNNFSGNLDHIMGIIANIIRNNKDLKEKIQIFNDILKDNSVSLKKGFKETLVEKYNSGSGYIPLSYKLSYGRSFSFTVSYALHIKEVEFTVDKRKLEIRLPYHYFIKMHKRERSIIDKQLVMSIEKELPDGRFICKVLKKLRGPNVVVAFGLVDFTKNAVKFLSDFEADSYLTFNKRVRKARTKKLNAIQDYMESLSPSPVETEEEQD